MRSYVFLLFLFLGLAMAASASDDRPAPAANSILVSGEGRYEAAPDTALVRFSVFAEDPGSAKAAYEQAGRSADEIRGVLRSLSIDPHDAEFGFLALQPVFDYRTQKQKLIAYRVSSTVLLKLRDFSKLAALFERLSSLDITANQSLSYTLEDTESAKLKAIDDAFRRVKAEAAGVARAAGRNLGELSYATVDVNQEVRPVPLAMPAAKMSVAESPIADFTPQRVPVTAHVTASFLMR